MLRVYICATISLIFKAATNIVETSKKEESPSDDIVTLQRKAWQFGQVRNPLTEPLKTQVETATTTLDLYALLGKGRVDDDLEIAYRIAQQDVSLGRRALKSAVSMPGGARVLRRRAWAKLGDLYLELGERKLAIDAYGRAIVNP